jgi:hypothetical protein
VPGVDVRPRGGDHVRASVTGQIGEHRGTWRFVGRSQGAQCGGALVSGGRELLQRVNWPTGQLGPVGLISVDQTVFGGGDQLRHVVPVEVGVANRSLAPRSHTLRIAGPKRWIGRGGEHAPVDADCRDAVILTAHLELHGELV